MGAALPGLLWALCLATGAASPAAGAPSELDRLPGEAVAEVAIGAVLDACPHPDQWHAEVSTPPRDRSIAEGLRGMSPTALPLTGPLASGTHLVQVRLGDAPLTAVAVKLSPWGLMPRAKGRVDRGTILTADQLDWQPGSPPRGAPWPYPSPEGQLTRRDLRVGELITPEHVTRPPIISAGDSVRLETRSGGVRATLQARAVQAAAVGELVRLRHPTQHRLLRARALGPGRARLEP